MSASAAVPEATPTQCRHVAVLGELGFEALDLGSEGERARAEQPGKRLFQLTLERGVL